MTAAKVQDQRENLEKKVNEILIIKIAAKVEVDSDKTDQGLSKKIKGGITIEDGYYHGNILSEPIEDLDGKILTNHNFIGLKEKQRLMKTRLMPVKCPSEDSDQCTAKNIDNSDPGLIQEVEDEDKYETAKKEITREKRFKKQENIDSIHLFSSFNYWMPIEMKLKKRNENNKNGEAEGEGENEESELEEPSFSF